jgi:hypothetical protein
MKLHDSPVLAFGAHQRVMDEVVTLEIAKEEGGGAVLGVTRT